MIVYDPTRRRPNWTAGAAEYLETILRKTDWVFEWGAGQSTVWLAERATTVVAMEHDPAWIDRIYAYGAEADIHGFSFMERDRFVPEYVNDLLRLAKRLVDRPDDDVRRVFCIDGWQRRECLDGVLETARTGDIILADDVLDYVIDEPPPPGAHVFAVPHPFRGMPISRKKPTISLRDVHADTKETWIWEVA